MTPGSADDAWAPPPVAAPQPQATVLVPGYADFRPIARGGSSDVYSAVQTTTRRPVAVKVVHLKDPEAIRHFERELEITVRLGRQHPNIVTVLDTVMTSDGLPCLVMELADLGSVDARLRELGPLPIGDVVALGTVVADALAFAHQQGVLHRDVKPPNILVLPTTYVLTDFGIARTLDAGHSASMELFSYRHAAPQVLDGEMPAAADDVYSLGSTMFTLLEGRAPFAGPTPEEDSALGYLRRARTTAAPALARPGVPPQLTEIIARCLAREHGDRPTASELHELLLAVPTEQRGWAGRWVPPAAAPTLPIAEPSADPAAEQTLPAADFLPPPPTAPPPTAPPPTAPPPTAPPPTAPPPTAPPPAALPIPASIPLVMPAESPPLSSPPPQPPPLPSPTSPPMSGLTPEREALLLATAQSLGVGAEQFSPDQTVGMRAEAPRPPETAKREKRGALPWAAAIILLLAGATALFLTHRGGTSNAASRPVTAGSPTLAATPATSPSVAGSANVPPPVAPRLISVKPVGSQFRLHWSDPSGGTDTFTVVQGYGPPYKAFQETLPGVTQLTVTPYAGLRACFQVIAINGGGSMHSKQSCLN